MKPYVLMLPRREEMRLLTTAAQFMLKKRGDHQILACFQKTEQLKPYLDCDNAMRLMICDVTHNGILPVLEEIRTKNPKMFMVLVADGTVAPVRYIRPSILPTALLWRPMDSENITDTLWEIISTLPMARVHSEQEEKDLFSLEVRGVYQRFSYKDILFFESKDKRLYLHLQRREIPFPGTLEHLLQTLPKEFLRVHKSYIVNRTRVSQVQYGQNLVYLDSGMCLPISRSYKADVKAVFV